MNATYIMERSNGRTETVSQTCPSGRGMGVFLKRMKDLRKSEGLKTTPSFSIIPPSVWNHPDIKKEIEAARIY
jgi:hypothetical protein